MLFLLFIEFLRVFIFLFLLDDFDLLFFLIELSSVNLLITFLCNVLGFVFDILSSIKSKLFLSCFISPSVFNTLSLKSILLLSLLSFSLSIDLFDFKFFSSFIFILFFFLSERFSSVFIIFSASIFFFSSFSLFIFPSV